MATASFPTIERPARYETLDAWRGLACLLVVVFHSTVCAANAGFDLNGGGLASQVLELCQWLWIGVPMFFVISGYCIAAAADSARRKDAGLRDYALRRFRRIFPPYWCALAASLVVVVFAERYWPGLWVDKNHGAPAVSDLDASNWLGTLTLTEGWRPELAGGEGVYFLSHAWTLGYEEQFYAVTGLLLLLSRRRFFELAGVVTAIVAVVAPWAPRGFFFDGHWLQFAAGVGVYFATVYRSRLNTGGVAFVLAGALAWTCHDWKRLADFHDLQMAAVAYGFALLLLLLRPLDELLCRAALLRRLAACGGMCYSLYLVHWPVVRLLSRGLWLEGVRSPAATCLITVPACVAASLVVGRLFYLGVERRFLNTGRPSAAKLTPPSAAPTSDPAYSGTPARESWRPC